MRRRNKFNAQRTVVDGISFASKLEAKRWGELRLLERAGRIRDLRRQFRYPLRVRHEDIATYVADFAYIDEHNVPTVEETKGYQTPEFRLKWALAKALYPLVRFVLIKR